ncbi:drug/metabolite exporter YedA [Saccharopolyspora taberi]|uniref:Drug/metabolite exporter YedA n=2 Tax=Saccharopolyspora taberi TaxID=60895 RepID=A0ABN3V1M3_9PSEU
MVALWLCWGSSFPAIRVMVAELPPLLASGAVFLTAGTVLAATRSGALRGLDRGRIATAAGVGVCLLGAQGAVAVAARHVYASTAALLVASVPLWTAVLRGLVGDRPGKAASLRLLAGFAGTAMVIAGDSGVDWSLWSLVVVAAAVGWAGGTVWAARSDSMPDARAATVVQLLAGGLVLLAGGFLAGEDLPPGAVDGWSWLALVHLVLVDSLAGFALYNRLLRTAPIGLVSTYAYAVPVVAYLIGVLVLGEPFRAVVVLGAAVIVAAVAAEVVSCSASRSPAPSASSCR